LGYAPFTSRIASDISLPVAERQGYQPERLRSTRMEPLSRCPRGETTQFPPCGLLLSPSAFLILDQSMNTNSFEPNNACVYCSHAVSLTSFAETDSGSGDCKNVRPILISASVGGRWKRIE
jgi:hypothetical protein